MEEWKKVKVLGSGTYGTVHLAVSSLQSSDQIAIKSADCSVSFAVESLEWEAQVLNRLVGAQNVVQISGEETSSDSDKKTYNLLLEYACLGSLDHLIWTAGRIPEQKVARLARMLLTGLDEIHSRGIVHCDLKSANILVFPGEDGVEQLKIADLGLAKMFSEGPYSEYPTWKGRGGEMYYNRGTATTASPESVRFGLHGPPADVWSMGCIIYEMMTGKMVWICNGNMEYLYDQILRHPIHYPPSLSPIGVDFLKCFLTRNAMHRWSAKQLLEHPFIVNNSKTQPPLRNIQPWNVWRRDTTEPAASCFFKNTAISTSFQPQLLV